MESEEVTEVIQHRYERFLHCIQQQDPNGAAEEFGRLGHWLRRTSTKVSMRALSAMAEAWIDLFWQWRRFDLMLKVTEDAEATFGPDPEWSFARGEALFNLARFDEARAVLEPLTHEDFEDAMLYFLLGCLAERRGEDEQARRLFETAHRLSPKEFALPAQISEDDAIAIYEHCLVDLPDPIIWHLKDVPIFVSPLPTDDLIRSVPGVDPLIMGLFMGQPAGEERSPWASDQPRILLFHKNIAKIAEDFDTLDDELRRTLFHEVGHFLGFSEEELEEMGLG